MLLVVVVIVEITVSNGDQQQNYLSSQLIICFRSAITQLFWLDAGEDPGGSLDAGQTGRIDVQANRKPLQEKGEISKLWGKGIVEVPIPRVQL